MKRIGVVGLGVVGGTWIGQPQEDGPARAPPEVEGRFAVDPGLLRDGLPPIGQRRTPVGRYVDLR